MQFSKSIFNGKKEVRKARVLNVTTGVLLNRLDWIQNGFIESLAQMIHKKTKQKNLESQSFESWNPVCPSGHSGKKSVTARQELQEEVSIWRMMANYRHCVWKENLKGKKIRYRENAEERDMRRKKMQITLVIYGSLWPDPIYYSG